MEYESSQYRHGYTILPNLPPLHTRVHNLFYTYRSLLYRTQNLEDACVNAAKNRLRPILMTTLTTVLSLIPMAFFPGEGSEMVQPIGQTVFGGLTFGTLMTLFLIPTIYYCFNRVREKKAEKRAKKLAKKQEKKAQKEPFLY